MGDTQKYKKCNKAIKHSAMRIYVAGDTIIYNYTSSLRMFIHMNSNSKALTVGKEIGNTYCKTITITNQLNLEQ